MPAATASPWSSLSENPASASSAWPNVWPRLSRARLPVVSRSSSATIRALAATECAMAYSRAAGSPASSFCAVRLAPFEEGEIVDQAVFDDLGVARAQLARRQRVEHGRVDEHQRRLMECADQILAGGRVDRGLAADRAVDLRQQRRRHLDEAASALDDRAGEPDQIADHPAAERDDMVAALDPMREQAVGQRFQLHPALGALAGRQHDRLAGDAGGGERGLQGREVRRDVLVADDRHGSPARQRREMRGGPAEQPALDHHPIASIAERDWDLGHAFASHPIAFRIEKTADSCGAWSLAMRIGACA